MNLKIKKKNNQKKCSLGIEPKNFHKIKRSYSKIQWFIIFCEDYI